MILSTYFAFLFWFILLIVFSFILDFLWSRIFPRHGYRFFITAGIIVHELSHAAACVLMRARISRIRFFAPEGGVVEHGPPRVKIIGKPIISLAPLIGCSLSLLGLFYLFGYQNNGPIINFSLSFFQNFNLLFQSALEFFNQFANTWSFWLFLFLTTSIAASIAPSTTDLKHAFWGLAFLLIVGGILIYFHIGDNYLNKIINSFLGRIVSLGTLMEFFALIITLPIFIIKRITKRHALL